MRMNRLAVLLAVLGISAANACLANDPAFCKSMCASEQRECRAQAQLAPKDERFGQAEAPEFHNPLARAAQQQVPSPGTRALDAAGDSNRKGVRLGGCDTAYQRCARACAVPTGDRPADRR